MKSKNENKYFFLIFILDTRKIFSDHFYLNRYLYLAHFWHSFFFFYIVIYIYTHFFKINKYNGSIYLPFSLDFTTTITFLVDECTTRVNSIVHNPIYFFLQKKIAERDILLCLLFV